MALCLALFLSGCTGRGNDAPTGSITEPGAVSTGTGSGTGSPAAPAAAPKILKRLDLQLNIPWAAVFLPNGTAIISERESALLKVVTDGRPTTMGRIPGVSPAGEGGLLGLALSPDFATDSYLYLYYTSLLPVLHIASGQSHRPGQAGRSTRRVLDF
jgi:glucose/arabinose dehydrogenase